jgi:signal peptidase I
MTSEKNATRAQKKGAKEILRLAQKALAYRRDLLSQDEVDQLETASVELNQTLKVKSVPSDELEKKAKAVDEALQKSGGMYYHKKGWVENVEMLLVAAIVVIGIRSFFLQPFIIPTNSMYPSFYGMQPHVYEDDESVPNFAEQSVDKILLGASHYRVEAEASGHLYLLLHNGRTWRQKTSSFPDGKFFVFPTSVSEYVFEIGGMQHSLRIPLEFASQMDVLLARKFAGIDDLGALHRIVPQVGFQGPRIKLSDRTFKKGEIALAFDVLLGDALFVDRFTYNFVKPKAGDPAVFRTGTIDDFNRKLGTPIKTRIREDKYYIKRLVGEPGDKLQLNVPKNFSDEIEFTTNKNFKRINLKNSPGILSRNGEPIVGCNAFDKNRLFVESLKKNPDFISKDGYPGYRSDGLMAYDNVVHVPTKNSPGNPTGQNAYFAMGDNSTDSLDGRAWGFVPEQAIVGRAFLVYYPFAKKRWGFSD